MTFQGRPVEGNDPTVVFKLARQIWVGEYDREGYVPGPGDRVVDIGANVGVFAVLAACRGAVVDGYEPHPETFKYLERNAAHWPGVRAHHAAVLGTPDRPTVQLWLDEERDDRHTIGGQNIVSGTALQRSIEVPAVGFAEVVGSGCDLLKLDCEGAEFDILLNSPPETLQNIARIAAEIHEVCGDGQLVIRRLDQAGFEVRTEPQSLGGLSMLFARRR